MHHDGQTLGVLGAVHGRAAALRVAGDGEGVGDVVGDQLAPDGGERGEVLVPGVPLSQDGGGDEERVSQGRARHPGGPGGAHS